MASRWWGLTRRQTVLAFGATITIGIVVALVLGGNDSTSKARLTPDPHGPARVRPGTRGTPHGVWAFGFETLRFDDRLRNPQQLVGVDGFGSVYGVSGRTYMYDAASGRVGVLRSASNRLEPLGTTPRGAAQEAVFAPTIAVGGGALWLVSAPGRLTRFELASGRPDVPIELVASDRAPVTTGVVAAAGAVFTATLDATGITVSRLDATTHGITGTTHLDLASPVTLDGFAGDATDLWVVAGGTVHELNPVDLGVTRTIPVAAATPGTVQGAAVAGDALWLLGDNGASLLRVDRATAAVSTAMKILPSTPSAFRIPAALVTDGRRVWAMVQKRDAATDHSVRVAGYDATLRAPTPAVDLPSQLFFGGLSAT